MRLAQSRNQNRRGKELAALSLPDVFQRAWNEFGKYYNESQIVDGGDNGNTRTIWAEPAAVRYLCMFLQQALHEDGSSLTVHEEFQFPPARTARITKEKRPDLGILDPAEWCDPTHVNVDTRRLLVAVEFKYILNGSNRQYSPQGVRDDCKKLAELWQQKLIAEGYMCVVVRRTKPSWEQREEDELKKKFPQIRFFFHHAA
jgi:hypothetical protein